MAVSAVRLTVTDARELMNIKKDAFVKTLGIIRQMADSCIRDASRRGKDCITFEIPHSVFGRESYDQKSMGRALAEQYYADGYDVTGTIFKLVVTWGENSGGADPANPVRHAETPTVAALPFTAAFGKQITKAAPSKKTSMSIGFK